MPLTMLTRDLALWQLLELLRQYGHAVAAAHGHGTGNVHHPRLCAECAASKRLAASSPPSVAGRTT